MFFIWTLGTGAQLLARPLFAHELGASAFLVLLITSSNALAQVVAGPITGYLTDHLGRKPLVLLGNAIRGVSCLLQFFCDNYWQFFILEFVGTIGVGVWVTSASVSMADVTTAANRGRLLALRGVSSNIGRILGPAAVALILGFAYNDLRYVFLFNAITKVFIHVLVAYSFKETAPERPNKSAVASPSGERKAEPEDKFDLRIFLNRGIFALLITSFAITVMGQGGAFSALFPIQAKEQLGLDAAEVGQIITVSYFIGLVVMYPSGWAIDRWGRKPVLIPGLILMVAVTLILARLENMTQIYVMVVLYGIGSNISLSASQTSSVDLAPEAHRGAFLGIWTTLSYIGSIFAPLILGVIATSLGYGPVYLLLCAVLLISIVLVWLYAPETRAPRKKAEPVPQTAVSG
jgi:MFS family permease